MSVPPEQHSELFSEHSNDRLVSASSDMSNEEIAIELVSLRDSLSLPDAKRMVADDPDRWRAHVMRGRVS